MKKLKSLYILPKNANENSKIDTTMDTIYAKYTGYNVFVRKIVVRITTNRHHRTQA